MLRNHRTRITLLPSASCRAIAPWKPRKFLLGILSIAVLLTPRGAAASSEVILVQDTAGSPGFQLDGKPLDQWIEEQKASGKVLSGQDASRIGVIENNGGETVNVRRSTVIRDSVVLPRPTEGKPRQ